MENEQKTFKCPAALLKQLRAMIKRTMNPEDETMYTSNAIQDATRLAVCRKT